EAAAAWSVDFDVDQLKGLLPDRESSDVLSCLADLRSSGFIEDSSTAAGSSTFRIRNALLREAAYLQCKKERLAELHERAAAYAEVQGYGPDFMGYHLERAFRLRKEAVPDDPRNGSVAEKAANHLHAAGRGERARGATTSAADLFRRALDLRLVLGPAWFDDSIELTDCLLDLARTREALEMVKLIQETAPQLGDAVVSARADLMKVFAKSLTSTDPTIEKSFRELLPIFEAQGDHRTLVKIYRGLSEFYWNLFECGASASAAESALQHSLETPEKFELAHIVSAVSYGLIWGPAPVSEAMAAGERLLTISVGNLVSLAQLKLKLGLLDAFAGNFDAARKRAESGLRELRELGQERFAAIRTHDVGIVQMMAGELTTAYETFLAGYNELTRLDMIDYRATSAAYLARIDYELGRAEQALKYLAIAEETAEEDPWIEPDTLPLRAQMAADAGERDRALKFIGAARALADGKDSTVIQATIEILTARALRTLGMEEKAAEAQAKAEALCKKKEAPALLALADPTSMKS
ncbi:MAG TPA: hypothetical protein VNP73_01740, partial [Actinomycetota bacterium]|nr:hypothetical protein [Actinomycetota bacterium]